MSVYRITRTTLRGQFENHSCFVAAMVLAQATGEAFMVDTVPAPGNNGGPNDRSFTLWRQEKPFAFPATCDPELITRSGKNGWNTESEARAVLASVLKGEAQVDAMVERSNAAAVDPANIAAGVAADVAKGAEKAAGAVGGAAAAAAGGAGILWAVEAVVAGVVAWWAAKRWLGKS